MISCLPVEKDIFPELIHLEVGWVHGVTKIFLELYTSPFCNEWPMGENGSYRSVSAAAMSCDGQDNNYSSICIIER